jgi:hypothetical protein
LESSRLRIRISYPINLYLKSAYTTGYLTFSDMFSTPGGYSLVLIKPSGFWGQNQQWKLKWKFFEGNANMPINRLCLAEADKWCVAVGPELPSSSGVDYNGMMTAGTPEEKQNVKLVTWPPKAP